MLVYLLVTLLLNLFLDLLFLFDLDFVLYDVVQVFIVLGVLVPDHALDPGEALLLAPCEVSEATEKLLG